MTRQAQDPALMAVRELHNDGVILVVEKPSGLPTQAPRGGGDNLYDRLRRRYPRLALHHRLDTPASGLVLFTLDPRANAAIARGFREHLIQRRYWACVVGEPPAEGRWESDVDGLPALTHLRSLSQGDGLAAIELSLQTGRTHQIRTQAAEAGLPLLGDHRHGGAAGGLWPRLALHAWSLSLDHPKTGRPLRLVCPLPEDLAALAARAGSALSPS
jgi:23S rRNA-/tRNA-specific pseudouridylate synthase